MLLAAISLLWCATPTFGFGFYAHRKINRMAVYALPPEMFTFYKNHIEYITEHAIDPDKRSHIVPGEDVKHYIDIEYYLLQPSDSIPRLWKDAVSKYTEDTLQHYGLNPWWVIKMVYMLSEAFKAEDFDKILYYSANIGHYIGDACTPLHTTKYYDGTSADQKGIHAFWETSIPELKADTYNYMLGRAEYIYNPKDYFWQRIKESHDAIDTIFGIENYLKTHFSSDKKYVYQERSNQTKMLSSISYAEKFDSLSRHMVERRMQTAVKAVAAAWFTAWVNAGQPDLSRLDDKQISKAHKKELNAINKMWKTGKVPVKQE